ncbi:MAG TPA: DUF6496 domain-containing protein [Cyclobacteriaceae bacterium]|jgi:hypothetical protein|nr:DUF6496 domain-containing protein [Cyclobacteriaceae bacterium]
MKHKKIRGLPLANMKRKKDHEKKEHKEEHKKHEPKKKDHHKKNKYSKKAEKKIHKVMKEFDKGELHSGSKKGPVVESPKQAIAIGISEARRKGLKAGKRKKK